MAAYSGPVDSPGPMGVKTMADEQHVRSDRLPFPCPPGVRDAGLGWNGKQEPSWTRETVTKCARGTIKLVMKRVQQVKRGQRIHHLSPADAGSLSHLHASIRSHSHAHAFTIQLTQTQPFTRRHAQAKSFYEILDHFRCSHRMVDVLSTTVNHANPGARAPSGAKRSLPRISRNCTDSPSLLVR
jgi:hypothetical protein